MVLSCVKLGSLHGNVKGCSVLLIILYNNVNLDD